MKRNFLLISIVAFFLCACDGAEDPDKEEKEAELIEMIDHDFNVGPKMDPVHLELLKELDICETDPGDTASIVARCSPENFKLYRLSETKSIRDAFLVQTKSAIVLKGSTIPLPVRHVMVFERENGKLVQILGIRGEMIAMEKSAGDYKDIYAAIYYKKDDTMFNCKFTWDGSVYVFSVESMDWGEGPKAVRSSVKDSVSNEIYASLRDAKLLF